MKPPQIPSVDRVADAATRAVLSPAKQTIDLREGNNPRATVNDQYVLVGDLVKLGVITQAQADTLKR